MRLRIYFGGASPNCGAGVRPYLIWHPAFAHKNPTRFSRGSMPSEQYKVMRQYLNILNCRIDLLLTKEDKIELENGTK